jgi:DNA-binding transcriptional ArsR family regulator
MSYDTTAIAALADPTRRRVFELVASRPRSVAALARELPVSQPAVSQHLKVLRQARLVRAEPRGASNIYHIDPDGLGAIRRWLDGLWTEALAGFAAACEQEGRERP